MKNTTAKIITKKLHGWLDDRAKHVPLPPLPDEILAKAVFQVPDSWVPVYAVSFDCDKGEEPAPDAWLKPDGQIVRNQGLLVEHAKTFGMPEGFLALYFGDAEQDAIDGVCQCAGCRLNRFLAGLRATVDDAIANERDEIAEQTATENAIFDNIEGRPTAVSDLLVVTEHAKLFVQLLDEHFHELPEKFKDLLAIPLNALEEVIENFGQEYLDRRTTVELVAPEPVIPAEVPFADGDSMAEALQEELGIARQAALYSIHQMKESRVTIEKGIGLAGNLAESARIASGRLSTAIANAEELMASIDEQEPWKPETITETMEAVADGRLTPKEAARIVCDMAALGEEHD